MKISVFGLGYVGCVCLGCLAKLGFDVIGVDIKKDKVDLINKGIPTIIEKDIDVLLKHGVQQNKIRATTNEKEAILLTDISFICVGTPNKKDGLLDLKYIYQVAKSIGESIKEKSTFHLVVIRSTVTPGTSKEVADIISTISRKKRFVEFDVISNPEFLREGVAVHDFFNPPYIVIGSENSSEKARKIISELYNNFNSTLIFVPIEVAEIIKFVNNAWHALKITFANEVGNICKKYGIDAYKVMELFCKDATLNISSAYLKPGFAYGGSCLPKDTRALVSMGKEKGLLTYILSSIERSNEYQIKVAYDLIIKKNPKKVAILGIAFKEGTDDVRFSPKLKLAKLLYNSGIEIKIHDPIVYKSIKDNINMIYIKNELGELFDLVNDNLNEVISGVDVIVVCSKYKEYFSVLKNIKTPIIDFVRLFPGKVTSENYEGICW